MRSDTSMIGHNFTLFSQYLVIGPKENPPLGPSIPSLSLGVVNFGLSKMCSVAAQHRYANATLPDLPYLRAGTLLSYAAKAEAWLSAFEEGGEDEDEEFSTSDVAEQVLPHEDQGRANYSQVSEFRKSFRRSKKKYFNQFQAVFFTKKHRPVVAKRLLSVLARKTFYQAHCYFSLHPYLVISRVFGFLNHYMVRDLCLAGKIFINHHSVSHSSGPLKSGDLVRLNFATSFILLYLGQISAQENYIRLSLRAVFRFFKRLAAPSKTFGRDRFGAIPVTERFCYPLPV